LESKRRKTKKEAEEEEEKKKRERRGGEEEERKERGRKDEWNTQACLKSDPAAAAIKCSCGRARKVNETRKTKQLIMRELPTNKYNQHSFNIALHLLPLDSASRNYCFRIIKMK
jgi:hypothetical protein